ncbi:tetracenomycin polyketide synthesis O-methyltransferase tcmP [Thozetella sp. PMI_491]|nr:tetracenomycin polyketide synthesis O-methyltransferase tcmP [Thozetella sp. PMI_491]
MASPPGKVAIKLSGVPETALYTLWVKAQDALKPDSRLHDKWALEAVERIEGYNFSKFRLSTATAHFLPLRSRTFDDWVTAFLDKHPDATVVNLACGVESRALRLLPSYPSVRWVDIDLPDMVALRQKLLPNPEGDYTLLAASATDKEWLSTIPGGQPAVVLAEGLTMYLTEETAHDLIRRVVDHFGSGELLFDTVGLLSMRSQQYLDFLTNTNSSFTWGVEDFHSIEQAHERLRLRQVVRYADYQGFHEMPLRLRLLFSIFWYVPWMRNVQANLRFEFGDVAQNRS